MTQITPNPAARVAWELLGRRPGTVFAMHIGYRSRAAEKGRTPEAPGYFLAPATSLSTGGAVELPAGAEILGFEGEIALVVATGGRRIPQERAWSHVAAVTAANDLGVFDFRWADKGANVRSKGGDGFTPIGPALLPAADLDPDAIEITTRLNGEVVQQDSTATLLFSLPRIVSDLSQLITLEPGDVILTGTPAGASIFGPGDTVEVEVTAGGRSTGRLTTTAVRGTVELPSYSAAPRATPEQWADASGRPAPAPEPALTEDLKGKLGSVALATLSSILRARGLETVSIDGLRSTAPGRRLVGTARTLRYLPRREDLFAGHGGGYNAQKRLFDSLGPDEVVVIDARGVTDAGTLGDILALRAAHLGAAGLVTDGAVRDLDVVAATGIVTYCAGGHPAVLGRRHIPWGVDETIACGGTTVQPGDIVVGDGDGLLVIPPALAVEIADEAVEREAEEAFIADQVRAGHPVDGLFPMNSAWRAAFEAARASAAASV